MKVLKSYKPFFITTDKPFIWIYIIAFLLFLFLPFLSSNLIVYAINLFMYMTMAIGWNIQGGYLGDISFGHSTFFGIGAYTVAILVAKDIVKLNPLNIFIGALVAMTFALIIGIPFLRLKGFYFSIGTLGLSSLMSLLFKNIFGSLTGGAMGIIIPSSPLYQVELFYYSILIITFLAGLLSYAITGSHIGLAFKAVRGNPVTASSLGINVTAYRIFGFSISAFIIGIVGGFYAYYSCYISPGGVFASTISFEMLVMVFLGGAGTLFGPILGSLVFFLFREVGRIYIGQGFFILPALLLVIVFLKFPDGIMGILKLKDLTKLFEKNLLK